MVRVGCEGNINPRCKGFAASIETCSINITFDVSRDVGGPAGEAGGLPIGDVSCSAVGDQVGEDKKERVLITDFG